jgi:hypothetical protein
MRVVILFYFLLGSLVVFGQDVEWVVEPILEFREVFGFSEGLAEVWKNGKYGYIDKTGKKITPIIYDQAYRFSKGVGLVEKNGKYGFIDKNGNEITPIIYDNAHAGFHEGLKIVKKDGKYGYIDTTGKEVTPIIYDRVYNYAYNFSGGLAKVKRDNKQGYIDRTGTEVIPVIYQYVGKFSEGLARVEKDGKYGYIDRPGTEVIPIVYQFAEEFSEGLAFVKKDGKYGYIDRKGKKVIPTIYQGAASFSEGLARVEKDDKYGYINKTGKKITPIIYDYHGLLSRYFLEGRAVIKKDGKYGYIDATGREITPIIYDNSQEFTEGIAIVSRNGKYGYINKTGKEITSIIYDSAYDFSGGIARVEKDGKYGYINKTGKEITSIIYTPDSDSIRVFYEGVGIVRKDGKYGYIDSTGKKITPIIYDYDSITTVYFFEGFLTVKKDGKYGYIDRTGQEITSTIYDYAYNFSGGIALVKKDGKFGYINKMGKEITPIIYNHNNRWSSTNSYEGLILVRKDGKYGFINKAGKEVIPTIYEDAGYFSEGLAPVQINGKWGIIRHPYYSNDSFSEKKRPKINFPNLPKTIEITDVKQFDLEICIQSPYSATETKLYVNNQLYPLRGIGKGSDDKVCSETIKKRITLSGYNIHTIKVVSTNEFGTTTAEKLIETLKGYDTPITIPKGKNYALFIGITDYQHHNDLMNPINDCEALIKVLTNKYNFDSKNIATLYDEVATRKNVLDKIEQYATDLSPSDNLLIYFAGHGFYDATHKRGSWIPYEATQTATLSDMITNNEVKDKLCLLNGNNVYVIADACFSGSMRSTTLDIPKDLEPWIRELQQQRSIRVFASGQLERVDDNYKDTNHSPFAHFLLKILQENTSDVLPAYTIEYGIIKEIQPETKQLPNGVYIDACNLEENKGQFIFYRKK